MSPAALLVAACGAVGTMFLVGSTRWYRRKPLAVRIEPYAPPAPRQPPLPARSGSSASAVLQPAAEVVGRSVSRLLGAASDLDVRLDRAGWPATASEFRMRQFVGGLCAALGAVVVVVALHPEPLTAVGLLVGLPLLALLAQEYRLESAAERRRGALLTELPVVAEQLGLLLSAGRSVPSALNRVASRSHGVIAEGFTEVILRTRHGVSEDRALLDWAATWNLDALDRIVGVLALHRDTGDLGGLVAMEAEAVRDEAHRHLIEAIEKRSQLVWIPVTVAVLVPGLILLAVPFVSAMAKVTGG